MSEVNDATHELPSHGDRRVSGMPGNGGGGLRGTARVCLGRVETAAAATGVSEWRPVVVTDFARHRYHTAPDRRTAIAAGNRVQRTDNAATTAGR